MNASGPESVSSAIKSAEVSSAQTSQQFNNVGSGIETQFHSATDIVSARSFFVPKVEIPAAPLSGIEHSGIAAMKAAEGAISPMLQLIMRLPGHLGLFSSFLEAFKNLFFSHDLLSNINLGDIASGIDLTHAANLTHVTHLGHAIGALPSNLHAFHNMSAEMVSSVGTAHLHINPFDSLKQSMNVSSGVDLKNPQFEGANTATNDIGSAVKTSGDSLAGPGLSAQAITPKLAPAERIFNSKSFEGAGNNYSNANNLLAFNNQSPATGITSSATNSNLSSLNQTSSSSNASSPATTPAAESITPQNSSNLSGLQAKALSLKDAMHGRLPHMTNEHPLAVSHKHLSNSPFSKMASSTRQAFQSAQKDIPSTISQSTTGQSYSIKSGDSLWQIANREFGNGSRWQDIYNLNQAKLGVNPSLIHTGTSISLPELGHGAIPNTSPSTSFDHSTLTHNAHTNHYTVKSGDNLWQISKNIFGNGDKWTQLYKLNGSTIGGNPRMIFSGQKLALSGTTNSIHPHLTPHNTEQLAHHIASPSTITHNQPVLAQAQNPLAHNQSIVVHEQHAVVNSQSIVAHHQQAVAHNQQAIAHNQGNVGHQLKYESAAADNRLAAAPAQQPTTHGLKVEEAHDQLLSGAGGAQAANNAHSVTNKLSSLSTAKDKSVVSFSLTPDLAQW